MIKGNSPSVCKFFLNGEHQRAFEFEPIRYDKAYEGVHPALSSSVVDLINSQLYSGHV